LRLRLGRTFGYDLLRPDLDYQAHSNVSRMMPLIWQLTCEGFSQHFLYRDRHCFNPPYRVAEANRNAVSLDSDRVHGNMPPLPIRGINQRVERLAAFPA
jgi:hypothetical protein